MGLDHNSSRSESFSEINVTPLTDVMLVLLITFLLSATSFDTSTLSVPLPQVREIQEIEAQAVILTVDQEGRVDWPDSDWNERSPEAAFEALLQDSSEIVLAFAVHRDCPYGKLFPLIVSASKAGWSQTVLLTEASE